MEIKTLVRFDQQIRADVVVGLYVNGQDYQTRGLPGDVIEMIVDHITRLERQLAAVKAESDKDWFDEVTLNAIRDIIAK